MGKFGKQQKNKEKKQYRDWFGNVHNGRILSSSDILNPLLAVAPLLSPKRVLGQDPKRLSLSLQMDIEYVVCLQSGILFISSEEWIYKIWW